MVSADDSRTLFYANQEHAGVRFVVLTILLVVFSISFLFLNGLFRSITGNLISEYSLVLSCASGLIIGLTFAGLSEYIMKRVWPSGLYVVLEDRGVAAQVSGGERLFIDWSKRVWTLKWCFSLKGFPRGGRERRVPSHYFLMACQIQQDETRFIVYSYMPLKRANQILDGGDFRQIKPGEYYEQNPLRRWFRSPDRPELPTKVLAGKDGTYWMAEKRRWTEGLELTSNDFEQFLNVVNQRSDD